MFESLAFPAAQNRAFVVFADGQVDRAGGSRDQRDRGGFVAFACNAQDPMASLDGHILDVGLARFADSQPVQAQEHSEGLVCAVAVVGGGEEHAELRSVQTASIGGVDLRVADVLGWERFQYRTTRAVRGLGRQLRRRRRSSIAIDRDTYGFRPWMWTP